MLWLQLQAPEPPLLLQGLAIVQQLGWGFKSGAHLDPLLFLSLHCLCFLTLPVGKRLFGGYFLPSAAAGCLVSSLLPPATAQVVKSPPELLLQVARSQPSPAVRPLLGCFTLGLGLGIVACPALAVLTVPGQVSVRTLSPHRPTLQWQPTAGQRVCVPALLWGHGSGWEAKRGGCCWCEVAAGLQHFTHKPRPAQ